MTGRPTYTIILQPVGGVDGMRALKAALKVLLRTFGLRCVSIRCEPPVLEQPDERRVAQKILAHGQ